MHYAIWYCNINDLMLITFLLCSCFHYTELILECSGVCHLEHGLHLVHCLYSNANKWRQINNDRGTITTAMPNGHIKMITSYNQDIGKAATA